MINELSKKIHENAKNKGFYEGEKNTGEMLMLIVTEVAEACEADRKNKYCDLNSFYERINQIRHSYSDGTTKIKPEDFVAVFKDRVKNSFGDELADIMIRVMDLAAFKGINLENHINLKMEYNSTREYKHGKKY